MDNEKIHKQKIKILDVLLEVGYKADNYMKYNFLYTHDLNESVMEIFVEEMGKWFLPKE